MIETNEQEFPWQIGIVEPEVAQELWDRVYGPMVDKALERSILLADRGEALLDKIMMAQALLVQVYSDDLKGVAVLEMPQTKHGKVLHVYTLTGEDMDDWLTLFIEFLRGIAPQLDCDMVTCTGRPGWNRRLLEYGFRTLYTTQAMRIEDESR